MRIVFVANYLPDTNYTRDLTFHFNQIMAKNDAIFLCGRKNEPVTDGKMPPVDLVWNRGALFFVPILWYIIKKRPNLVHFQQEFKLYGGVPSSLILPWLFFFLRIIGIKIVVTPHGIVSPKQLDGNFLESFGLKNTFYNKVAVVIFLHYVYRLLVLFSNKSTVHTPFLRRILVEQYRCDPSKIIVVEHGIREIQLDKKDTGQKLVFRKYPLLKNKNIILVFGYFSPRKGFEYLINAFERILREDALSKDWVMVLAGDVMKEFQPYKRKIERLIRQKKMAGKVVITGFIDAPEVDELYRISKVSVIPAVFSFNTSGALAMSLAYKKPLLVSNVKPIANEVSENEFGLLFENNNPDSFGKQLKQYFNKKTYARIQKDVERSASKRYWRIIAKQHRDIYKKILQ